MPDHVFVADFGGSKLAAAIVDRRGRIASRRAEPVDLGSPLAPVLQIRRLAREFAGKQNTKSAFAAAAVAVPGLVRPTGTVWAPNLPGWERMPLASRLRRSLGIPVIVESDRNAAILGEVWRGAARGKSDAITVIIGTGIGAGILSGGRLVRGAHELSGCAGWMVVRGDKSREAKRFGELEALTAGPAIERAARRALAEGKNSRLRDVQASKLTAYDVATAARRGDPLSREIFKNAGRLLGYGIANLVSLFDPEIVVIAGGMAGAADLFMHSLTQAMLERAQPIAAKRVRIAVSKLGGDANLLGCALLAWKSGEDGAGSDAR